MIPCKITFLSINAHHHLQVCWIGSSGLQNECKWHYPTADSVLTSGCSHISQHIWINICIVLAILGFCIRSKIFNSGRRSMWLYICGQQMEDLGRLSFGIVTGRQGWRSGQRWHLAQRWCWLLCRLSGLVRWRCTCSFASPACLQILCGAILAKKASVHVILIKRGLVSFYRSLHQFMPRKLNNPLLLLAGLGARFLDQILRFLYCDEQKSPFGYSPHIEGQSHVGLFQLYPTSLPCYSTRNVDNLQEISCCFNNESWQLPQPYTFPSSPVKWLKSILSTPGDAYQEIRPAESHN